MGTVVVSGGGGGGSVVIGTCEVVVIRPGKVVTVGVGAGRVVGTAERGTVGFFWQKNSMS